MKFFRCIKEYKGIKPSQVVVDSYYHWHRTVVAADSKNKTLFFNIHLFPLELKDEQFFIPLTMKELNKLKPHLYKMLLIDYNISFNEECLKALPNFCCYECGKNTFGTTPVINKNTNSIGKCFNCGKEKQELLRKEYFKIDIFNTKHHE